MSDDTQRVLCPPIYTVGFLTAAIVIVGSVKYYPVFFSSGGWLYPIMSLCFGLMVIVPLVFARLVPDAASFDRQWLPAARSQWAWFVGMVFLLAICGGLSRHLTHVLFPHYRPAAVAPSLVPDYTITTVVYYGIIVILLAPIAEEFFFRGYLIEQFRKLMSSGVALLAQSIIFALYHLPSPIGEQPVAAFLYGVVLGTWRLKFRSLLPLVLAHMLINSIATIDTLKQQYYRADLLRNSEVAPEDIGAKFRSDPKCYEIWQLTSEPSDKAIPGIIEYLGESDVVVTSYAMSLLVNRYKADAEPYLKDALESHNKNIVKNVLFVVGFGRFSGLRQEVRTLVWSGDDQEVQFRAATALWDIRDMEDVREIAKRHPIERLRRSAEMWIGLDEEQRRRK